MAAPTHFVLDHNFPLHAVRFAWPPTILVTPLANFAPELTRNFEDWEVFIELSVRGGVDGFITNDVKILHQATEMVALTRTRLKLVVTDGVGHEPLRATGLVMVGLEEVVRRPERPAVHVLRPGRLTTSSPNMQFNKLADARHLNPGELFSSELAKVNARLGS